MIYDYDDGFVGGRIDGLQPKAVAAYDQDPDGVRQPIEQRSS